MCGQTFGMTNGQALVNPYGSQAFKLPVRNLSWPRHVFTNRQATIQKFISLSVLTRSMKCHTFVKLKQTKFWHVPHSHLAITHGRACATQAINYKMSTNEWIWILYPFYYIITHLQWMLCSNATAKREVTADADAEQRIKSINLSMTKPYSGDGAAWTNIEDEHRSSEQTKWHHTSVTVVRVRCTMLDHTFTFKYSLLHSWIHRVKQTADNYNGYSRRRRRFHSNKQSVHVYRRKGNFIEDSLVYKGGCIQYTVSKVMAAGNADCVYV